MPKFKIACFIVAAVLAAVGTILVVNNLGEKNIGTFVKPTDDPNIYLDKTEDTVITDTQRDVREFLFIAHKVLLSGSGFKGESSGTSTAVGMAQNVLNTRYVTGEFGNKKVLKEMVTKGIVKNAYQLYLVGDNYIFRQAIRVNDLHDVDWKSEAQPLSESAFYSGFGHRSDKLTGYILNWDTVLEGNFVSEENGLYTFHYVLDTVTATTYLRREMITNGDLDGEPTFTKCEIYVTMDSDFNVKSLRTDCAYNAKTKGIPASCTEDITERFESFEGDLPETEFFTPFLGKEPAGNLDKESSALDMLMEMFAPYLNGEDELKVRLTVSNEGEQISDILAHVAGLEGVMGGENGADLSKLAVNLKMGDLNACYRHQTGKILLNYREFNGSTTVNGIKDFIAALSAVTGENEISSDGLTSLLGDDPTALLDKMQGPEYSEDKSVCTVTFAPFDDADICARLVGIRQNDKYIFDSADIDIGNVGIHIVPQSWTPVAIKEDSCEILGLTDLLKNGKISLNADVKLPIADRMYDVNADILVDLAKLTAEAHATLGSNGDVDVYYVDNIAYVALGNIKFKLDVSQTDKLKDILTQFTQDGLLPDSETVPSEDFDPKNILSLLSGFEVAASQNGAVLTVNVGEMKVCLNLVERADRWNVESCTAQGYGIDATIIPAENYRDILVPADADLYADVTEFADTFDDPIAALVQSETYGADFSMNANVDGHLYNISGNVVSDEEKTLKVVAVVSENNVGILNAEVIYANNIVYLAVNGIRAAFAVTEQGADGDKVEQALQNLLADEQLKQLLEGNEQISEAVAEVGGIIQKVKQFDPESLWDVDFTTVVTRFLFADGTLSLTVDGSAFGLEGAELSCDLSVKDGNLAVEIHDLELADIQLDCAVTLLSDIERITVPSAEDYILNLRGEIMGAQLDISLDLVNMDIWSCVHFGKEDAYFRFVDGKLLLLFGGARVAVDVEDLSAVTDKVKTLLEETAPDATDTKQITDLLAIVSALSVNFTDEQPNISFDGEGLSVRANFTNKDGNLLFDNLTVNFVVGEESYEAKLTQQTEQAYRLHSDLLYIDGNRLIDEILDTVIAFKDAKGFAINAELNLNVNGNAYIAEIDLNLNGGVYGTLSLRDVENAPLVSAEVYFVDGVLYFDINGIRQSVDLSQTQPNASDVNLAGILDEMRGSNELLDSLLKVLDNLPSDPRELVYSEFISDLYQDETSLYLLSDLSQLDLGDVALVFKLGAKPTVSIYGLSVGEVSANAKIALDKSYRAVKAPQSDYTTDISVSLGEGIRAGVHLDLFNKSVYGELNLYNNGILFEYLNREIFLQFGNISAKLAVDDFGKLLETVNKFTGDSSDNQQISDVLKQALGKLIFQRTAIDGGYCVNIDISQDASAAVFFLCDGDKVAIDSLKLNLSEREIVLRFTDSVDVRRVDMNRTFVELAQPIDAFDDLIARLISANSYGAAFELNVKLGGKPYTLRGNFTLDEYRNIQVNGTVYDGETGIVDLDVIVSGDKVFLTVNGIKATFKLGKNDGTGDIAQTFESLMENEQIAALLEGNSDIADLIRQIKSVAENISSKKLSEVNFEKLLGSLTYNVDDSGVKTLSLQIDASEFDLGTFDLELRNDDDILTVAVKNLKLGNIQIDSAQATVQSDVSAIDVPEKDYLLKLHIAGEELGISADITANLYSMDIWGTVQYVNNEIDGLPVNETLSLRFVNKELYLSLNNINLKFNVNKLGGLIDRVKNLLSKDGSSDMNLNEILSHLQFDLAGDHKLVYESDGMTVSVNFSPDADNKLVFDNISVTLGGKKIEINNNWKAHAQLDTDGKFTVADNMADKLLAVVERFINADHFNVGLTATVSTGDREYTANVNINYNNGICASVTLSEKDLLLVCATITLKDHTLYIDANGIQQKFVLPESSAKEGDFDVQSLKDILDKLFGINGFIDEIMTNLADFETVSDLLTSLDINGDLLTATVSEKLGLGAIRVTFDANSTKLSLYDLKIGSASVDFSAELKDSNGEVTVPDGEFTTELHLDLGEIGSASVELDLFNNRIYGLAKIYGNNLTFEFNTKKTKDACNVFIILGDSTTGAKLKFDTDDIGSLIEQLSNFGVTLPEIGSDGDIIDTLKTVLQSCKIKPLEEAEGYELTLEISGVTVKIEFTKETVEVESAKEKDIVKLGNVKVSVNGFEITGSLQKDAENVGIEDINSNEYIDVMSLLEKFAAPIGKLIETETGTYQIDNLSGTVKIGDNTYSLSNAIVKFDVNGNLYIKLDLSYNGTTMFDDLEIWLIDKNLYVQEGELKLALPLNDSKSSDTSLDEIKDQLKAFKNKIDGLEPIIDWILSVLNKDLLSLDFTEMLNNLTFDDSLGVTINGAQIGLSEFGLTLNTTANDGISQDGISLQVNEGSKIMAYDAEHNAVFEIYGLYAEISDGNAIEKPGDDFKTNLVVKLDESNTLYAEIDLFNKVFKMKIVSTDANGNQVTLDLLYQDETKTLKITDGTKLYISVNINSIGSMINAINTIVNEQAGSDPNSKLPGLDKLGDGLNIDEILRSLALYQDQNQVKLNLKVLGLDMTVSFDSGTISAHVPVVDGIELNIESGVLPSKDGTQMQYGEFLPADDNKYVHVDEVFNDFYIGNGTDDNPDGPIYELVTTNAWRFDFTGNADISIGGSGEYRIANGSYFIFAFNKSETEFSLKQMLDALGNNSTKQDGYDMLFKLLNTLQLRANLTIQKQDGAVYKDIMYLDIALLRYAGADNKDGAKSRLYIHYDTCKPIQAEDGTYSRTGELNITLSIDALKNVIGLKDALDKVLGGMISKLVDNINGAIADLQNNKSKLQIGTLASLFTSVSYDEEMNFKLKLNGNTISKKLGELNLSVSAYGGAEGVGAAKRGRGLQLNEFTFGNDDFSINLTNIIVSAATSIEIKDDDGKVTGHDYDYVIYGINSYLQDHVAKTGSVDAPTVLNPEGALSTIDSFNKSNVAAWGSDKGYNMSNHINLDSIYQLAASLVITAGRDDGNGHRSFKIEGPLKLSITVLGFEVKEVSIPILFYADIDENGDSYFAVKIHRDRERAMGADLFGDRGGDSYLTFTTNDGNGKPVFNVYRNSNNSHICPKCSSLDNYTVVVEEGAWIKTKNIYRICKNKACSNYGKGQKVTTWSDWSTTGKMDSEYLKSGEPGFKDEGISPAEFMANLLGGERSERGYLFDLLNLGSIDVPLLTKICLDQTIKDAMNDPTKEFGIEDVLDTGESYNYGTSSSGDMQFEIIANLLSISDGLGTLTVNIHHSGDFNDLYSYNSATDKWEYDAQKIAAINLSRLEGNIGLAKGFVHIDFDLQHTTPGYGTAWYFNSDLKQMWKNPEVWEKGYAG